MGAREDQQASPAPLFGRPHRGCRSSYLVSVASKRFRVRFSAPAHMRVRAPWSGHRADAGLVRAASCIEAKITLETDMNGALMTASSRFAIAAALGLVVGVGSARAADLGGNCCADLEERVAELEATTARKGNRKMSLTITGQLNRMIMFWDDGHSRGVYYGIDNVNTSSRFSLLGEASATPWLKFGFEIMLEGEGTSASTRVSQLNEDGSFSSTTYMAGVALARVNNNSHSDSFFGDARRVAAWAEHKELG